MCVRNQEGTQMTAEEHAETIRARLRSDMRSTLNNNSAVVGSYGTDEFNNLLDDLVSDAMHQVEQLLTHITWKDETDGQPAHGEGR